MTHKNNTICKSLYLYLVVVLSTIFIESAQIKFLCWFVIKSSLGQEGNYGVSFTVGKAGFYCHIAASVELSGLYFGETI